MGKAFDSIARGLNEAISHAKGAKVAVKTYMPEAVDVSALRRRMGISAAKLTTPTTVVLDFSTPITCANTDTVVVDVAITDVAGNAFTGSLAERTLTYMP